MTQLKILIAGAGIAGLAAKRAFALRGIEADIVERDPVPRTTGAGLYLPGNAVRALRDLGLHEPLMQVAEPVYRQELRDVRGRVLAGFPVNALWGDVGECLAIRRKDLHGLLLDAVGTSEVRFGTAVREVGPDGTVRFDDGTRSTYDLVVGADGIYSPVRFSAYPSVEPDFLGQVCWRFLAPSTSVAAGTWTVMLGDRGRTFLAVPVGEGEVYCNAAIGSADPVGPAGDWRSLFSDFSEPVTELLAHADEAHYAPLYEIRNDERTRPHVVLIGDAEHACSPSMAQGSAMAVEDALVLAETLAGARERATVPPLLAAYRERRADRLRFVLKQNHARDRARHLPTVVRRVLFRHFATNIFRANHAGLLPRP
ncbi:FAD-dependent monooxygenase [Micromonospora arida]|uniref:FAD-dependent monooxygenase n=1 Tax=Micromonospora zamorensis TaxID=709883 RepID=A0ABZ1PKI6_9ACTN